MKRSAKEAPCAGSFQGWRTCLRAQVRCRNTTRERDPRGPQRRPLFFIPRIKEVIFEGFLRRSFNTTEPPPSAPHCPTASEREIIQLLAEGKSNKEVAQALGISVKTAEPHCAAIVRKLGLSSFSEIVR